VTERLEGKPVVENLTAATTAEIRRHHGLPPPQLVSVHRATTSPFSFYLKQQGRAAEAVGIRFRETSLGAEDDAAALIDRMRQLDADPAIDGVLLEHPLPAPFDFFAAVAALRPEKDVDGVSPGNLGRLVAQRPIQVPAVARAAVAVALHYGVALAGQRVAVVGRSPTVGIPLALLLLARREGGDATVTVAHSKTESLAKSLAEAKVIFSCVGQPGLLNRTTVPRDAWVIDVGLSSVPDASRPSGVRAVGDADAAALEGWAAGLTPVPGGVGPVTVAELMSNTVHGWSLLHAGSR
jgi:methylenetetrahydrofolate dehydrogenase (NADP+) / methenyltetrahydrofolate cyclohydrolase